MKAPLFWFLLEVACELPSRRACPVRGRRADDVVLLGYGDETVVRPCLPVPIGSRLGEIAESLFAFTQRRLNSLVFGDVHECAYELQLTRFIGNSMRDNMKMLYESIWHQ